MAGRSKDKQQPEFEVLQKPNSTPLGRYDVSAVSAPRRAISGHGFLGFLRNSEQAPKRDEVQVGELARVQVVDVFIAGVSRQIGLLVFTDPVPIGKDVEPSRQLISEINAKIAEVLPAFTAKLRTEYIYDTVDLLNMWRRLVAICVSAAVDIHNASAEPRKGQAALAIGLIDPEKKIVHTSQIGNCLSVVDDGKLQALAVASTTKVQPPAAGQSAQLTVNQPDLPLNSGAVGNNPLIDPFVPLGLPDPRWRQNTIPIGNGPLVIGTSALARHCSTDSARPKRLTKLLSGDGPDITGIAQALSEKEDVGLVVLRPTNRVVSTALLSSPHAPRRNDADPFRLAERTSLPEIRQVLMTQPSQDIAVSTPNGEKLTVGQLLARMDADERVILPTQTDTPEVRLQQFKDGLWGGVRQGLMGSTTGSVAAWVPVQRLESSSSVQSRPALVESAAGEDRDELGLLQMRTIADMISALEKAVSNDKAENPRGGERTVWFSASGNPRSATQILSGLRRIQTVLINRKYSLRGMTDLHAYSDDVPSALRKRLFDIYG